MHLYSCAIFLLQYSAGNWRSGKLQFTVSCADDASAFEYVSCSNGEVFDFCEDNDNKGQLAIVVTQMDDKNTDKNGLVATLNFKVKATADDGEYKISFDKETNFSNIEGELQEVSFKSGTVTIK